MECKGAKKGGFEVFNFANHGGNAYQGIAVGDDCTEALGFLANSSGKGGFLIDEVSTGTPDRTIYTLSADGEGLCGED